MKQRFSHRIPSILVGVAIVACMQVLAFHVVKADKPNSASAPKRVVNAKGESALRYTNPAGGAVDAAVGALSVKRSTKPASKTQSATDTSKKENKIVFARVAADEFTARVELQADEQQFEMGIYNMLGKKMMDVHRGALSRGIHDFALSVPNLPEGVYICIMQGSDFRRAEKFYLSR